MSFFSEIAGRLGSKRSPDGATPPKGEGSSSPVFYWMEDPVRRDKVQVMERVGKDGGLAKRIVSYQGTHGRGPFVDFEEITLLPGESIKERPDYQRAQEIFSSPGSLRVPEWPEGNRE